MIQIRFEGQTLAELIQQTMEFVSETSGRKVGFVDEAPKQEAPKVDLTDLRSACLAYRDKHGQAALIEAFGKVGAKKLTDVPAEKYAELMEMVKV